MKPHTLATIHKDGSVTFEGKGFSGGECVKAAKPYRDALGGTGNERKKPEFYDKDQDEQGAQQGG